MQIPRLASPSVALFASFLAVPHIASAFYLPGVAPTSYKPGDVVPLYVNTIKPIAAPQDAMLHSVVAYDYYLPIFKFCQPEGGAKSVGESLGSILFGDRIMTSPFELNMAKNESCKSLCDVTYTKGAAGFVNDKIQTGYSLNWLVDGLPAGQDITDELTNTDFYSPGFLMGEELDGKIIFNNHYDIIVEYHEVGGNPEQLRVVGVIVQPRSLAHSEGEPDCAENRPPVELSTEQSTKVRFSYGVFWVKSSTAWATRWDKYLHVFDPRSTGSR